MEALMHIKKVNKLCLPSIYGRNWGASYEKISEPCEMETVFTLYVDTVDFCDAGIIYCLYV